MRIKLTLPRAWPVVSDEPRVAEVLPGVTLTTRPLVPLPKDLNAWGDEIVFGVLPRDQVRVALVKDMGTAADWPVTLFGSDVIDPRTKAVLERRLHAVYRFDRHGAVATLASSNTVYFDSIVKDVTAVLLAAEPDWSGDDILYLDEIWKGLVIESRPDPVVTPAASPTPPAQTDGPNPWGEL